MPTFQYQTQIPFPRAQVFRWFSRPGALVRLTPSFFGTILQEPSRSLTPGSTAAMGVGAPGGLGMWLGSAAGTVRGVLPEAVGKYLRPQLRWDALHTKLVPDVSFTDVMAKGPLASWVHEHGFADGAPGTTLMSDHVDYELPAPTRGGWTYGQMTAELERMFAFRERQIVGDLSFHAAHPGQRQTIAVTGASGLVGSQLCALLTGGGHTVLKLVRRAPRAADEIFWDPDRGVVDTAALARCHTVINLAGHPIGGRFTDATKRVIRESRVRGTSLLAAAMAQLASDGVSRTLVCGSAMGYYGARPHATSARPLVESDPPGTDFLAGVVRDWEAACSPAERAGVRVVNVRTGLVLSAGGGFLQRLLPLYLAGVGGPLGEQWQSWIGIDDIAGIFAHAALTPALEGPVNAVAPTPVTGGEFARTLGRVLHRPAALKVPPLAPRVLLGRQGAEELALASQRVSAAKVQESGYGFRHTELEAALRHILGKA